MDELLTLLNKSGLKQDYLAAKLNVSPEYLSMVINGKRKGKKVKDKLLKFLKKHLEEKQPEIISDGVYNIKDKIIIQQTEEIFKLKNQLLENTYKVDELIKQIEDLTIRMDKSITKHLEEIETIQERKKIKLSDLTESGDSDRNGQTKRRKIKMSDLKD